MRYGFGCRFGLCFSRGSGRVAFTPWKKDGTPGEGWAKLPAWGVRGWGSLPPCCLQPSPEVRICQGGEVCTKHVRLLPSPTFSQSLVLNKISLLLALKAFYYEGRSWRKGWGRFSWKAWLRWIQLCLCLLLVSVVFCLFNTHQVLGISSHAAFHSCTDVTLNFLLLSFT